MKQYSKIASIFIFCFVLFIVLSLSSIAQSSFQVQQSDITASLNIEYPKLIEYPSNTNIELNFHIFNSTGSLIPTTDVDCRIHIYNSTGGHAVEANLLKNINNVDLYYNGTFTEGVYSYIVGCNSTTQDGFESFQFIISKNLNTDKEGSSFVALITIFGIISFVAIIYMIAFFWLKDDENSGAMSHRVLRLATGVYIVYIMILIPKAVLDAGGFSFASTGLIFYSAVTYYIYGFTFYLLIYLLIITLRQYEVIPKLLSGMRKK